MKKPIYFDNNATTPVAPEVVEAMLPFLREHYGNPSSPHRMARAPALAVAKAREQVAQLVNVPAESLVFTSGGTESNAMAITDALAQNPSRNEVIFSAVEHASVWAWRDRLIDRGIHVRVCPVDQGGALDLAALTAMLSERTALVSIMLANNETGIVYPVNALAELIHRTGALFHTDAVQAVGKIPVNLEDIDADYASICCHKYNGCKGIGVLYTKSTGYFCSLVLGGEQEYGRRPGTEPVPLAAGMGAASYLAGAWLSAGGNYTLSSMRDSFEVWLRESIPGSIVIGRTNERLPNTSLVLIPGVETEPLLAMLDMEGIACSSGSACASGAQEPSHVLKAMGLTDKMGGVLRISSGRYTTESDYRHLQVVLPAVVEKLRR